MTPNEGILFIWAENSLLVSHAFRQAFSLKAARVRILHFYCLASLFMASNIENRHEDGILTLFRGTYVLRCSDIV